MAETAADVMIETLLDWGVDTIFGLPGDGINGLMEACDTLFLIGTSLPYIEFYPAPGQAKCVQLDLDSERIGLRYDADIGLVGDSKATLQQLIPLLKRNEKRDFLEKRKAR